MKKEKYFRTTVSGKIESEGYRYRVSETVHGWRVTGADELSVYVRSGRSFDVFIEKIGDVWNVTEAATGLLIPSATGTRAAAAEALPTVADRVCATLGITA